MGIHVEDPVIALRCLGRIDPRVVDHPIGAKRPHKFHSVGAAHAGHLRTHRLRDLNGERADVARRAHDEDPVAVLNRAAVPKPESLECEDSRVRQSRSAFTRHLCGHQCERPFWWASDGPARMTSIIRARPLSSRKLDLPRTIAARLPAPPPVRERVRAGEASFRRRSSGAPR